MKRFLSYLPVIVVAGLAAWWLHSRWARDDEQRIRLLIDDCIVAARERSPGGILSHVDDEGYEDGIHHEKTTLRYTLLQLQLHYKEVRVNLLEGPTVTIADDGQTATAELRADVFLGTEAGPPTDTIVQDARRGNRFLLRLRKKEGEWLIVRVEMPPGT